jgi:hypothetical protein
LKTGLRNWTKEVLTARDTLSQDPKRKRKQRGKRIEFNNEIG